jgi:hypothetical protein
VKIAGVAAIFFKILTEVEDKIIDSPGGRVYVVSPYNL